MYLTQFTFLWQELDGQCCYLAKLSADLYGMGFSLKWTETYQRKLQNFESKCDRTCSWCCCRWYLLRAWSIFWFISFLKHFTANNKLIRLQKDFLLARLFGVSSVDFASSIWMTIKMQTIATQVSNPFIQTLLRIRLWINWMIAAIKALLYGVIWIFFSQVQREKMNRTSKLQILITYLINYASDS